MKYQDAIAFGIIGLGRFGTALATALAQEDKEVLVLDSDEKKIKNMSEQVASAFVVESLDKQTLLEAGIQNCDTVIVCVGENIQTSIITTLNVIELGVARVIAKAVNAEHGRVLEKLGAVVIYPEREQALRLAQILTNSRAIDRIELSDEFSINEFQLTKAFDKKQVIDADIRGTFHLNIIALIHDHKTCVDITPEQMLYEHDHIVVVGNKANLTAFGKALAQ